MQSADRSQPNIYEYFPPTTEHHDFEYLTGLDRSRPPGSVLVLNPRGETYKEILYTSEDVETVKKATGIQHVFAYDAFLEHLSSAITDFRNLRITQLRFKPVASDISRGWGAGTQGRLLQLPALHQSQRAVESADGVRRPGCRRRLRKWRCATRPTSSIHCG